MGNYLYIDNVQTFISINHVKLKEKGGIHSYPSCMRMDRGNDRDQPTN